MNHLLYQEITTSIDQQGELEKLLYFKRNHALETVTFAIAASSHDHTFTNSSFDEQQDQQSGTSALLEEIYSMIKVDENKSVQARLYIMRAYIFIRSKQYLKALQDFCCVKSVDANLVPVDLVKRLLMLLDESEMDFVVKMDDWITQLVKELDDHKLDKVKKYLQHVRSVVVVFEKK